MSKVNVIVKGLNEVVVTGVKGKEYQVVEVVGLQEQFEKAVNEMVEKRMQELVVKQEVKAPAVNKAANEVSRKPEQRNTKAHAKADVKVSRITNVVAVDTRAVKFGFAGKEVVVGFGAKDNGFYESINGEVTKTNRAAVVKKLKAYGKQFGDNNTARLVYVINGLKPVVFTSKKEEASEVLTCGCGATISSKVAAYSTKHYGKPMCMTCQRKIAKAIQAEEAAEREAANEVSRPHADIYTADVMEDIKALTEVTKQQDNSTPFSTSVPCPKCESDILWNSERPKCECGCSVSLAGFNAMALTVLVKEESKTSEVVEEETIEPVEEVSQESSTETETDDEGAYEDSEAAQEIMDSLWS